MAEMHHPILFALEERQPRREVPVPGWRGSPSPRLSKNEKMLDQQIGILPSLWTSVATSNAANLYYKDNLCGISSAGRHLCLQYLLGILDSKLLDQYYRHTFTEVSLNPTYLENSHRPVALAREAEVAKHDRMAKLVDSMLALHEHLAAAKSESQKTVIQRQIDATDAEIDRLVYDLYGLTAGEIAIVEEASK